MKREIMCRRESSAGLWKAIAVIGLILGIAMTVVAFIIKRKSDKYRDALIDLSDELPDDTIEAKQRRENWQKNQSRINKRTVEEQMADRRIEEDV